MSENLVIPVDMEVAESTQMVDMEVAEQIIVNPPATVYEKLAETELTVSTTGTSTSTVSIINVQSADIWTPNRMICVAIRDKAGKRAGYCLGSDTWFVNENAANGTQANQSVAARLFYDYVNGLYSAVTTVHGVYAGLISPDGSIKIYARYNASYGIIDGTYKVEVYKLAFPDSGSPFV